MQLMYNRNQVSAFSGLNQYPGHTDPLAMGHIYATTTPSDDGELAAMLYGKERVSAFNFYPRIGTGQTVCGGGSGLAFKGSIQGQRSRRRRITHSLVATMDPVAVARRNERERNRVRQVNDGFDALRRRIPVLPEKKKLSKVEILRFAMTYIRELQELIRQQESGVAMVSLMDVDGIKQEAMDSDEEHGADNASPQ